MKLKNITTSTRELRDSTGKVILVKSKKTIELDKAIYNKNSFKLVKEKPKYKHKIEQKEEINIEKEVN